MPVGQTLPQPPQLLPSLLKSTQTPRQAAGDVPAEHSTQQLAVQAQLKTGPVLQYELKVMHSVSVAQVTPPNVLQIPFVSDEAFAARGAASAVIIGSATSEARPARRITSRRVTPLKGATG